MDHRQLADNYRHQVQQKQKELNEAGHRIFDLESALADRDYEVDRLKAENSDLKGIVKRQLALTGRTSSSLHVKGEDDNPGPPPPSPPQQIDALRERNKELQTDIATYTTWMTHFEERSGVAVDEAAEVIITTRTKLHDAQEIEALLRTQIKNLEKKASKVEKAAEKAADKTEKTEGRVKTLEMQLKRANERTEGRVKTLETQLKRAKISRDVDSSPLPPSSPKTPTLTPSAKADARKRLHDQDDDEERAESIKVSPSKRFKLTPVGERLGRRA